MTSAPRLSAVIACQTSSRVLMRCLHAFEAQQNEGVDEIIVVSSGQHHVSDFVRQTFPSVTVIHQPGAALVPELWALGVARSRESVIALSTAEMVPQPGWAAALLAQYASEAWAAVGGPIVTAPQLGTVDTAIYWLRYHRFARPALVGVVSDLAGDNASYSREALRPYLDRIQRDGFWEYELNQDLVAAGQKLLLDPAAAVEYAGGESFADFARQRLTHGRRFGVERFERTRGLRAWLYLAAWPLTPAALLSRILRGARGAGKLQEVVPAVPALIALIACWSSGELLGYISAAIAGKRRPPLTEPAPTA